MKIQLTSLLFFAAAVLPSSAIERISVLPSGSGHSGAVNSPFISPDSGIVAFESTDTGFVDSNDSHRQVYAYSAQTKTFSLVSVDGAGNAASADCSVKGIGAGGHVLFQTTAALDPEDNNGTFDVYLRDLGESKTYWVSFPESDQAADGNCFGEAVSRDGRFVLFTSSATNLISPSPGSGVAHLYRLDRTNGELTLISQSTGETQGNGDCFGADISEDGMRVVFGSDADNLIDGGGDTNGTTEDIFIRDLSPSTPTTKVVSLSDTGSQLSDSSSNPSISDDGNLVCFRSDSPDVVSGVDPGLSNNFQIYIRVLTADTTLHVSRSNTGDVAELQCQRPEMSRNGRYVVFYSKADNLAQASPASQWDVFARDLETGITARVSVTASGGIGNGDSTRASVSDNGIVAFLSEASNLVPDDDEGFEDVFTAPANTSPASSNSVLKASLLSKLKKLKKKAKKAKKSGKVAKAKKFKKKIKTLKKRINSL